MLLGYAPQRHAMARRHTNACCDVSVQSSCSDHQGGRSGGPPRTSNSLLHVPTPSVGRLSSDQRRATSHEHMCRQPDEEAEARRSREWRVVPIPGHQDNIPRRSALCLLFLVGSVRRVKRHRQGAGEKGGKRRLHSKNNQPARATSRAVCVFARTARFTARDLGWSASQ